MSNSRKFHRNSPGFALFFLLGALALSGCATSQSRSIDALADDSSGSPAEFDQTSKPGVNATRGSLLRPDAVQPGYLWEISSLADKGINGKFRVDFDGKLRLAYGIVIDSDGLNDTQMRDKIVESFRPFLKSTGEIHVALVQKKLWIDVRGLVSKPGRFLVDPSSSLDEVLTQAGGIVPQSQAEYVQIQQKSGPMAVSLSDYYDSGNSDLIPPWEGGDILFVQRKSEVSAALASASHPVIEMMGEVKTPGEIPFKGQADFLYYLTRSGGPSSVADLSKIEVIRWVNGKRKSQVYDWDQSHEITRLEPNDIVVVHSNQPTKFERGLQSATGIAAILSAIGILIIAL